MIRYVWLSTCLFAKGYPMTKKQKTSGSVRKGAKQVVKTGRIASGTGPYSVAAGGKTGTVTPTSERIIKATSVKRRTAMKVLANR